MTPDLTTLTRGAQRWAVIQQRIAEGLCRDCGNVRGADGTADRCADCAEKRRRYQRDWRASKSAEKAAGGHVRALGDTAPRVLPELPEWHSADGPYRFNLAGGNRLMLRAEPSAEPALAAGVNGDTWAANHWRCELTTRTKTDRRIGTALVVTISAGPGFDGQRPTLRDVLALLLLDAKDARQPFDVWAPAVGLSVDSRRAEANHKIAQRRAAALGRLLGKFRPLVARRMLGAAAGKAGTPAGRKGKAKR